MAYPLYEAINDGGAIALFHTGQTGVGSGMPGGMGMRLKYSNPMYMDDVAADFPDLKIILAHPVLPLAGRGAVGRDPQAERLYRPLRLVAEIFPADPGALHQLDPAGQDAVRLGLAGDHAGPLAGGFCQARHPRRDPAEGIEGQRAEDFGVYKEASGRWRTVDEMVVRDPTLPKSLSSLAAISTASIVQCLAAKSPPIAVEIESPLASSHPLQGYLRQANGAGPSPAVVLLHSCNGDWERTR